MFKSANEKRTAALTDETLPEFDLAGGLSYADDINRSADHGKDSLRWIVKRLKVKNGHVQMLALQLLDVCAKNCSAGFHAQLAGKDTLGQLADMAVHRRTPAAVRDLALTLIETWSEAFGGGFASGRPGEPRLAAFTDTYRRLKSSGVEFPARDMQALAPVQTPMRNAGIVGGVNRMAQQQQMQRRGGEAPINPYGAPNEWQQQQQPQQQQYGGYSPGQMQPPQPQQPPQLYTYPPPMPLANPVYPQHQMQQRPPFPAQPAAPARPALTPAQQRDYEQWTTLCPSFVSKVQRETLLVLEHALLMRDLCSAAGSAADLQRDPLAGQLAAALSEARNRYTKLILSAGDEQAPEAQPHAEFVIDLSIRMIDVVRGVLDFHSAKAQGRSAPLPDVSVPRELTDGGHGRPQGQGQQQGLQQQQQQQAHSPQRSPPDPSAAAGGSGGSAPRTQQLFDMPADADEEDEKRSAAAVFAQSRVTRSPMPPAAAASASSVHGSPNVAAATAAAAAPSTHPVSPPYVSPDSFAPVQSFSSVESFGHHSDAHRAPTSRYALPAAATGSAAGSSGWSSGPSFHPSSSGTGAGAGAGAGAAADSDSSSVGAQSGQSDELGVGDGSNRGGSTPTPFDDLLQSGGGSASVAPPPAAVDRSYAGQPHRTRAQEEAERESARREADRLARQQEDAARAFDLLMPMRAFDGHAPGQSGLRHVGQHAPNAAAGAAGPAAAGADPSAERDPGALSPGGPAASPTHAQQQAVAAVDDAFLAEMAALTVPQRAETKEGEA